MTDRQRFGRPPAHICDTLHRQLGPEQAEAMINDWEERATGTSSFPRIDPSFCLRGLGPSLGEEAERVEFDLTDGPSVLQEDLCTLGAVEHTAGDPTKA